MHTTPQQQPSQSSHQSRQQGSVMALNGWTIRDIGSFSKKLHIPDYVTLQMIQGFKTQIRQNN